MTPPITSFIPGPTNVPDAALEAMASQVIGHRSPEYSDLHVAVGERLQPVFRTTRPVISMAGSATIAMEMAIASLARRRVLHVVGGGFAERWEKISRSHGIETTVIAVPWGDAVDPALVRAELRRADFDAVAITHSETSTGVLNPVRDVARVVRDESDALVLADCVSSLAGAPVEFDEWGIDFAVSGAQKALAAPPGVGIAAVSERAVERAAAVDRRGFYTDLLGHLEQHERGFTLTTPPINVMRALLVQLERVLEEGLETRWERHEALRLQTERWAEAAGFGFASTAGSRSPTVSCLRPPAGIDVTRLRADVAEAGFTLGAGYGPWRDDTFRIGHMGEVQGSDLEALCSTIDEAVDRHRVTS
jgi:aspartate aminotransferase-like enzyme